MGCIDTFQCSPSYLSSSASGGSSGGLYPDYENAIYIRAHSTYTAPCNGILLRAGIVGYHNGKQYLISGSRNLFFDSASIGTNDVINSYPVGKDQIIMDGYYNNIFVPYK